MSTKPPAFQFYPKDYESDELVKMMSLEQEGAFLRLLCHAWLHGSIPADKPALARICRVPTGKMARLWPGVEPCFVESEPGRLINRRQERQREAQERHREGRVKAGQKGADAKWKKVAEPSNGNGNAIDLPMAKDGSPFATPFPSASATDGELAPVVSSSEKPPNANGNGLTDEERKTYADDVWSKFLEVSGLRGTRLMSPGEYSTLSGWMDGGIPLRVVLRGLSECRGKGRMLSYYHSAVQEAYEQNRQAVPL